jgi:glucan-binding YG repeat protein
MEASKTGFCYNLGTEDANFILKVVGTRVTMYKGSVSSANVLSGWVNLKSDNGVKKIKTGNRVYDKYYIDSKGKPKTGVQTINGKTYFFGEGGLMERGLYDKKGGYLPKRKYNVGTVKNPIYKYRYFYQTGGSMRVGYKDKHHYNAKTGFMVVDKICKSRHYNKDGKMSSGWTTVKGKKYYFSKGNGLMYTGKKSIGTKWYKFNKKGVRTHKKVSGKWKKYDAKGQKLK